MMRKSLYSHVDAKTSEVIWAWSFIVIFRIFKLSFVNESVESRSKIRNGSNSKFDQELNFGIFLSEFLKSLYAFFEKFDNFFFSLLGYVYLI